MNYILPNLFSRYYKSFKIMRILYFFLFGALAACNSNAQKANNSSANNSDTESIEKINKSDEEWKAELSEMEYYILREKGTERAFTGDLWEQKKGGLYICAGCELELFDSDTKFESGTGWPSFYQPIKAKYIAEDVDYKIGYKRVEVLCARCGGHLGHVFPDGPKPTGLRYCINSAALDFVEKSK
jgi:peptide-methionine (R)-S-oxide reductase